MSIQTQDWGFIPQWTAWAFLNAHTVQYTEETEVTYIRLPVLLGDPDVFRYGATADVLHVLVENPNREFTTLAKGLYCLLAHK